MKINSETGEVTFDSAEMYIIVQSCENSDRGAIAVAVMAGHMCDSLLRAGYRFPGFNPATHDVRTVFSTDIPMKRGEN